MLLNSYAGSGLPQDNFQKTASLVPPLSSGLTLGFCECPAMGPKVGKEVGFGVQKWIKMGQSPVCTHSWTHFRRLTKDSR